jgi:hypothetical protein
MWVVLRSRSGEATSANFDGWKMSVCSAGFTHGDANGGTAKRWVSDVVPCIVVIIPRNLVTPLD